MADDGAAPPPRVTSNSQLSVRKQIQLARHFKELEKSDAKRNARTKTRFRKAKANSRGRALDDEPDLRKRALPTFLLVDGYNIIGYWPKLTRLRNDGDLPRARDALSRRLEDYAHYMGWRSVVVFDAPGNEHSEGDVVETMPSGVAVVYSAEEADTYITAESKRLLVEEEAASVFVATGDFALQQAVEAHGGHVISSRQLVNQMTALQKTVRAEIKRSNAIEAANFGAFTDHLSGQSLDALAEIEKRLHKAGPPQPIKASRARLRKANPDQQ